VSRHVITPSGFFDFFGYIPRIFGLMLASSDLKEAKTLIKELSSVADLLVQTTTLGNADNRKAFALCLEQYAGALLEAGLKSALP